MLEALGSRLGLYQIGTEWCGWISEEFVTISEGEAVGRLTAAVVWAMVKPTLEDKDRKRLLAISSSFLNEYQVTRLSLEDYLLTAEAEITDEDQAVRFIQAIAEIGKKGDTADGRHCVFCGQLLGSGRSEADEQVLIQGGNNPGLRPVHRRCHERYERRLKQSVRPRRKRGLAAAGRILPYGEPGRSYLKGFLGAAVGSFAVSLLLLLHEGLMFILPFPGAFAAHRLYEAFAGKWGEKRALVTALGAVLGLLIGIWLSPLPEVLMIMRNVGLSGFVAVTTTIRILTQRFLYTQRLDWFGMFFRWSQVVVSGVIYYYFGRILPAAYRRAPLTYQRFPADGLLSGEAEGQ